MRLIESKLKLEVTTARDLVAFLAPRPMDSNKGMYGHVLIVGGSLGKSGAAAMAGMAALRAGAGLVTVATAKSALPNVAGFAAELMTEPLPETDTGGIAVGVGEERQAATAGVDHDGGGDRAGHRQASRDGGVRARSSAHAEVPTGDRCRRTECV